MSIAGVFFTNNGRELQAKVQTGAPLKFTRIAIGDGELNGQAPQELSDLVHHKMDVAITKLVDNGQGEVKIGGEINNSKLTGGFYYRELGLFAQDPVTKSETLYCYGNAGALAEYIPSQGSEAIEKSINIIALIANAKNVSAVINSSLVYLTHEELQAHEEDVNAHKPLKDWVTNLFNSIKLRWDSILDKPQVFPPSAHKHTKTEITDFAHIHDDRYYTEAEMNQLLAQKAPTHDHPYIPTSASCNKNWIWSGQGGQPQWLWGGHDGQNMYVYNPKNFDVNSVGGYDINAIKELIKKMAQMKMIAAEYVEVTTTAYKDEKRLITSLNTAGEILMSITEASFLTIVVDGVEVCNQMNHTTIVNQQGNNTALQPVVVRCKNNMEIYQHKANNTLNGRYRIQKFVY